MPRMNKREFLRASSGAGVGWLLGDSVWARFADVPADRLAQREDFWDGIRAKYRLKPDYINLESGYYSMQAEPVLEAFIAKVREANYEASYYLRTKQVPDKLAIRTRLAAMAGCSPDEFSSRATRPSRSTRSSPATTGSPATKPSWPNRTTATWSRSSSSSRGDTGRSTRSSQCLAIRHPTTKSSSVYAQRHHAAYAPADGQPHDQRHRADSAGAQDRRHGARDAASTCWSTARTRSRTSTSRSRTSAATTTARRSTSGSVVRSGTGILYVRKDKIPKLWPIFGDWRMTDDADIEKLNHTGTHPVHTDLAIDSAIAFHNAIGIQRKEARLRYLQNYWTSRVRGVTNVVLNTPSDPARTCAIANVGVAGVPPADLATTLLDKYRIWTNAVDNSAGAVQGVRVTPHVFILPGELDVLVKAIREIASS